MPMKVVQRMLYVGLGGTGLEIGIELERALRSELCGPNGKGLDTLSFNPTLEPFQLPDCLRFVYVDFDEAARTKPATEAGKLASPAVVARSSATVANLVPSSASYAAAADLLRTGISLHDRQPGRGWLPGSDGEPKVGNLREGAAAMPTVGRAALIAAFKETGGTALLTGPLSNAVSELQQSGAHLSALAGSSARDGIVVFVGFSVAGGTGAGVFYDALRLIADTLHGQAYTIYPLVVLPSAFAQKDPEKQRARRLNGGAALRDLFELIDNSNWGRPQDNEPVKYPGASATSVTNVVDVVPVSTAFLFSRPKSLLNLTDMHRSVVSFVVSVVGTTIGQGAAAQPLASTLVNNAAVVGQLAPDGLGGFPATTALAAELRVPLERIAEILSRRLLAQSIERMLEPAPGERNTVKDGQAGDASAFALFVGASGLKLLRDAPVEDTLAPLRGAGGAKGISAELHRRREEAIRLAELFGPSLDRRLGTLAEGFDWIEGTTRLSEHHDLFRASRVILGNEDYEDANDKAGIAAWLTRYAEQPAKNQNNYGDTPPAVPSLKDTIGGMRKIGLNHPLVAQAAADQDSWLEWREKAEWRRRWNAQRKLWERRRDEMTTRARALLAPFTALMSAENDLFKRECGDLYGERTGVRYFLPPGGPSNDLDLFYRRQLLPRLAAELGETDDAEPHQLLRAIMAKKEGWALAHGEVVRLGDPDAAYAFTLARVREEVQDALAPSVADREPLLPRIGTLLESTAAPGTGGVSAEQVELFQNSLAGLLPPDFEPEGEGALKIDIFHPATPNDAAVASLFRRTLLQRLIGADNAQFHPLEGTNFVTVALRREVQTSSQLREYRDLLVERASALDARQPADMLPWRQRLGHDPVWLALREPERVRVLRSLLIALHDGLVQVAEGDERSPSMVLVRELVGGGGSAPIELQLRASSTPGAESSSWAYLVCAYERYLVSGATNALARCETLLSRIGPNRAEPPNPLYSIVLPLRDDELEKARALYERACERARERDQPDPAEPLEIQFWGSLLKQALNEPTEDGTVLADISISTPVAEVPR